MFKKIMLISLCLCSIGYAVTSHSALSGTNIHTVYRWQFADSAARVNQSVSAADTMKFAYQRSDSTSWILVSTTGARWKKIAYASNQNTLTTSTMTLDSLKLTKGINATGGTFSGALTGTTLNTGNGANELYAMDHNLRTTDAVTFATVNTGHGANELYPMDQDVRTSASPYFNRVGIGLTPTVKLHIQDVVANPPEIRVNTDGTPTSLNQALSKLSLNIGGRIANITGICETDIGGGESWVTYPKIGLSFNVNYPGGVYEVLRLSNTRNAAFYGRVTATDFEASDTVKGVTGAFSGALSSTTLNTGLGNNELHPMDQAVLTTSPVTFTTVNTGNGANELYPMNQPVTTTSDVVFDSSKTRVSNVDSLRFGSGSYLKAYLDTTFYDSLFDGGAYKSRALCRLVQIGNQVTLYQPQLSSTSFSSGSRVTGIPSKFLGSSNFSVTCFVYSNGTTEVGSLEFNNTALGSPNNFIRTHSFGLSTGSGTHGLYPCCLTWVIN